MVRAGKVAKGFTPRGAEKVQEIDAQTDPASTVIPRLKEWWSAFVIQRAWRRKRDGRIPLRWDGSWTSSGSRLDAYSSCGESNVNSRSDVINYARKNKILRLLKNLTVRLLEARPHDAKGYLLSLLEALKASRVQQEVSERFSAGNNASVDESSEHCQIDAVPQLSPQVSCHTVAEAFSSRLGIFSEKDLHVLFDYCTRTKGTGAALELKNLAAASSSKSSLAYEVLEAANNMCSNGLPSLHNFSTATSKPIEECFSLGFS